MGFHGENTYCHNGGMAFAHHHGVGAPGSQEGNPLRAGSLAGRAFSFTPRLLWSRALPGGAGGRGATAPKTRGRRKGRGWFQTPPPPLDSALNVAPRSRLRPRPRAFSGGL